MAYAARLRKKRLGRKLDSILATGYFMNCNYHPVRVTTWSWWGKDVFGSDVEGTSLTDNTGCSCSLFYCSPEPVTEAVAMEMAEHWRLHGDRGLAVKYGGWTDDGYTEFEKEWR